MNNNGGDNFGAGNWMLEQEERPDCLFVFFSPAHLALACLRPSARDKRRR